MNELNGVFEIQLLNFFLDFLFEHEYNIPQEKYTLLIAAITSINKNPPGQINISEYDYMKCHAIIRNNMSGLLDNFELKDHLNL